MTSIRHCPFCGKEIDPEKNICESCKERIHSNREKETTDNQEEPVEKKKISFDEYVCPLCGRYKDSDAACCNMCKVKIKTSKFTSLGYTILFSITYIAALFAFIFIANLNKIFFSFGGKLAFTGYIKMVLASFIISIIAFIKAFKTAKNNQQVILLKIYKAIIVVHVILLLITLILDILFR